MSLRGHRAVYFRWLGGWMPTIVTRSTRQPSKIINLGAVYNQREEKEAVIYSGNLLHFSSPTRGMATTPISQ